MDGMVDIVINFEIPERWREKLKIDCSFDLLTISGIVEVAYIKS